MERPCKECGCPLIFVMGPNGKTLPLDKRSPVFHIIKDLTGNDVVERLPGAYVTHFCTCPSAAKFSRGGR